MAEEKNQKIKLMKIMEILRQETDEEHPMTKVELSARLVALNVSCSPRSLIRDIKLLNEQGYEIMERLMGHEKGYFVCDRSFSVPELKILIDAVQAASFVTEKKTGELVDKIAALGGSHRAGILNKLADLSTDFAVKILKLTDGMKGHYSLVNQLERSATSIGANIREAKYAHSKADFVAKLQIALKECYETEYWLELMQKAELLPEETVKVYLHDCGSIRRMLIASINTTKAKQ